MSETAASFVEWMKEKHSSPLYIVFFLSFLAWNWQFFFTLFFESPDSLGGLTKIEAATKLTHFVSEMHILSFPIGGIPLLILNWIWLFSVPILVTYLMIWWVPYISAPAHKRYIRFYFNRKKSYDLEKNKYDKERIELLEERKEVVEQQSQVLKEIATTTRANLAVEEGIQSSVGKKEKQWVEEAGLLLKSNSRKYLEGLYKLIYESSGWTGNTPQNIVAYAHTNELIDFEKGSSQNVQLTPKGRVFLRVYIEEF